MCVQKKKTVWKIVKNVIWIIIGIAIIWGLYQILLLNFFNGFERAIYEEGKTEFERDNQVKYSSLNSYKITSHDFNDAMFYRTVDVIPNTAYRVTCMVKTENIETEQEISNAGAQICIADTLERSASITGTNDWKKLEFMFHSKNRESVELGFRLGSYDGNCKGTVWFSDFTLEMGAEDVDTNWNFATFIFKNIDVPIDNQHVALSMQEKDINTIKLNMERFKSTCAELSNYQMTADYDIIEIDTPITSISYDEENGYYVGAADVATLIEPYINQEEYDHIFAVVRLGDNAQNIEIPVHDWIGLGGMDYLGIGFSNIRLPNDNNDYIYTYSTNINTFPEEVFLHEFLHSLERNLKEYGYKFPELHDYEKYGYQSEPITGLKRWYQDYMQCTIPNGNGDYVGLDSLVYILKPLHSSNFTYTVPLSLGTESENVFDVIRSSLQLLNQRKEVKKETNTLESFRI